MPAFLRIEIFPTDIERTIAFYTNVLRFTVLQNKGDYVNLQRDSIFIGANTAWPEHKKSPSAPHLSNAEVYNWRRPPVGTEIVIEVDDLNEEREWIKQKGWEVVEGEDIKAQPWGLTDFRVQDPDGFYLRITEHSPSRA